MGATTGTVRGTAAQPGPCEDPGPQGQTWRSSGTPGVPDDNAVRRAHDVNKAGP